MIESPKFTAGQMHTLLNMEVSQAVGEASALRRLAQENLDAYRGTPGSTLHRHWRTVVAAMDDLIEDLHAENDVCPTCAIGGKCDKAEPVLPPARWCASCGDFETEGCGETITYHSAVTGCTDLTCTADH